MKNIVKLVTVFVFVYTIIFSTIDILASSTNAKEIAIKYRAYINGGWEAEYRNSGGTAGNITDKTIKAMEIMLENTPVNISYQTYDSNNKWGKIVKNGASTANLADAEAIEAIKINIDNLSTYNIKYRVRPEGQEWLPWVSNNEVAGSTELGLGVEAVEIKLVPEEMPAVWLSTVANIDWPASGSTAAKQQSDLKTMLDNIVAMNMNTVVFQVSPTSDAFYKSDILPWSKYLTGVQGQDPGYDPLAFLITEAKARGLEVHAWFNPYRITMAGNTDVNALAADHPARKNPAWVMQYGAEGKEQLLFNPGIPAVQEHVVDVVNEVVTKYDIDAVHMDDYFYPYPVSGISLPDQDTFAQYGGDFSKIADWRRNNVNTLVRNIGESIKNLNPNVQFGISPFGIWRNSKTDPTGSATNGLANYDDLYADTRTWIKNEYIDYITPQLYWSIGYSVAEYKTLVDWWANEVVGTNVNLYIGQAIHNVKEGGANGWGDTNPDQISQQLAYNRTIPEVKGSMHFRYYFLMLNNLNVRDNIVNNFYNEVVLAPRLPNGADNQNDSLNLEKYTVSYELNGGKGDFPTQTVTGGEKFTIPAVEPTKTNYSFVGWYLDEKLTEKVANVLTVTDNVTLYAKWEEKANETKEKYTVSFDLNGGSGNFSKILVTSGSKFVKPSEIPTRDGYKFSGWFSQKENGNEIVFPLTIDSDTVLYAHWSKESVNNPRVVPEHPSTGDHTNLNICVGCLLAISVVTLISRKKKI